MVGDLRVKNTKKLYSRSRHFLLVFFFELVAECCMLNLLVVAHRMQQANSRHNVDSETPRTPSYLLNRTVCLQIGYPDQFGERHGWLMAAVIKTRQSLMNRWAACDPRFKIKSNTHCVWHFEASSWWRKSTEETHEREADRLTGVCDNKWKKKSRRADSGSE